MPETNSTPEASVSDSPVDQIAQVLVDEDTPEEPPKKDEEGEGESQDEEVKLEEPEEDEEEDTEEVTWSGTLGVDESKLVLDDNGDFKGVKVKIDGQESEVDINTLITGYQTAKSTTQKSQALAEDRRKFTESANRAVQAYQGKLKEAEAFVELLKKKFTSDYDHVDWMKLRTENPAEYAAVRADLQNRQNDIANMTQAIRVHQKAAEDQIANQNVERDANLFREEAQKSLELIPEWSDKELLQKDFAEMRDYVGKFGFSPGEFDAIRDARVLLLLRTVMKNTQNEDGIKEKRVEKPKAPTFQKATRRRQAKKSNKLDRLISRAKGAKGSNKRRAQTDAVAALLLSGD